LIYDYNVNQLQPLFSACADCSFDDMVCEQCAVVASDLKVPLMKQTKKKIFIRITINFETDDLLRVYYFYQKLPVKILPVPIY